MHRSTRRVGGRGPFSSDHTTHKRTKYEIVAARDVRDHEIKINTGMLRQYRYFMARKKYYLAEWLVQKMRREGYVLPKQDRMPNYKTAADFVRHRHNILKDRILRKALRESAPAGSGGSSCQ